MYVFLFTGMQPNSKITSHFFPDCRHTNWVLGQKKKVTCTTRNYHNGSFNSMWTMDSVVENIYLHLLVWWNLSTAPQSHGNRVSRCTSAARYESPSCHSMSKMNMMPFQGVIEYPFIFFFGSILFGCQGDWPMRRLRGGQGDDTYRTMPAAPPPLRWQGRNPPASPRLPSVCWPGGDSQAV